MRGMKRFATLLALLAALLLLTGCIGSNVQGTKYTAFKETTAALVECATTSYDLAVNQWVALGPKCLAKYSSDNDLAGDAAYLSKWDELQCGTGDNAPIYRNPRRDFEIRLQILMILSEYASKLNLVATTDYSGNVVSSTSKIGAQAASVAEASDPLLVDAKKAKDAVKGLAAVVGKVLSLYLESKREEALRQELDESQDFIDKLAKALQQDHTALNEVSNTYLYKERLLWKEKPRPTDDFEKRIAYDMARLQLENNHKLRSDALTAVNKALNHLSGAHAELRQSLDKAVTMESFGKYLAAADEAAQLMRQAKANSLKEMKQ